MAGNIFYFKPRNFPELRNNEISEGFGSQYYKLNLELEIDPNRAIFISLSDKKLYTADELKELKNNKIYFAKYSENENNLQDFLLYKLKDLLHIIDPKTKKITDNNVLRDMLISKFLKENPKKAFIINKYIYLDTSFAKVYLSISRDKPYLLNINSIKKSKELVERYRQARLSSGAEAEKAVGKRISDIIKDEYKPYIKTYKLVNPGSQKEDLIISYKNNPIIIGEIKKIDIKARLILALVVTIHKNPSLDTKDLKRVAILNKIAFELSDGKYKTMSEFLNALFMEYQNQLETIADNIIDEFKNKLKAELQKEFDNLKTNLKANTLQQLKKELEKRKIDIDNLNNLTSKDIEELKKNIALKISEIKHTNLLFKMVGFPSNKVIITRRINGEDIILYTEKIEKVDTTKGIDSFLKSGRVPYWFNNLFQNDKDMLTSIVYDIFDYFISKSISLFFLYIKEMGNIYIININDKDNNVKEFLKEEYLISRKDFANCIESIKINTSGSPNNIDSLRLGIKLKISIEKLNSILKQKNKKILTI